MLHALKIHRKCGKLYPMYAFISCETPGVHFLQKQNCYVRLDNAMIVIRGKLLKWEILNQGQDCL